MKLKSFIILFVLVMVSCLSVNTVYAFEKNVDEKLMGPVSRSYILREKYPNRTSYFLEESFISRNYLSSNNNSIKNPLLEMTSKNQPLNLLEDSCYDCCSAIAENSPIDTLLELAKPKIEMGNFEYKAGEFQGPWGDLTEYVNQLSGNRGYKTRQLLEHVGKAPVNEGSSNYAYSVDRWKDINGKGVVRYSQGGSTPEDWNYLSSGDSNFASSACGAYSTACVLSTMLGKYINVPEVAIAVNTYELRNPGSDLVLCNSDGDGAGAFRHTDLAAVIREAGLQTEVSDVYDREKVDKCLEDGGMVIYVVGSNYGGRYTYGAHYIVIREKTETGYLVYSSTNWSNSYNDDYCNTENTAEELSNLAVSHGAQMILVNY